MKKLTTLILSCAMACSFCACSITSQIQEIENPFSIDDFQWSIDKTTVDGAEGYYLTLQNNSGYDIDYYTITYTGSKSETKKLFADTYKDADSTVSDKNIEPLLNAFGGSGDETLTAGSKGDPKPLYIQLLNEKDDLVFTTYTMPTDEQFEAMKAENQIILKLEIIKDKTEYNCEYNAANNTFVVTDSWDVNE